MKRHLQNLKRQLLADKKKLGVMIVLCVFGLLLWGRLLLRDVPRTATAKPRAAAQAKASDADRSPSPSARPRKAEVVRVDPGRSLGRDLFRFDPNRYRRTLTPDDTANLFATDNSEPEPADESVGVAAALDRASRLDLRSVVTGARACAVIDGRLVKPGEMVEEFVLLDVVDRYVHLEINGIVIRLWM